MGRKSKRAPVTTAQSILKDAGRELRQRYAAKKLDQDPISIALDFPEHRPKVFSIIDFIESGWGLNMRLYPAQRFLVKLYYFLPLDNTEKNIVVSDMFNTKVLYRFTELEYLHYLYQEGRCNIGEQDHERRELVLAIGRRGGKSTLSGIFATYEIYKLLSLQNPQQYYGLPNGNRIQLISIAADKDQASILFNEVSNNMNKCEYFKPYVANNTQTHINLRTPHDIERYGDQPQDPQGYASFQGKTTIRVTFKGSSSRSLRGPGNIVVIFDEMAHYHEEGSSSAKEIYDAITPSTAAFSPKDLETGLPLLRTDGERWPVESRVIAISSPLNKTGKFYALFYSAMTRAQGSDNLLAIQAPTWEINPTLPSSYYKSKYHSDPTVFMTEHGAQFSDRVKGWLERKSDLMACIDSDHRPVHQGQPKHPYYMGIDLGLANDGTAFCITTIEDGRIVLVYHEYWIAGTDWRDSNPHLDRFTTEYCKTIGTASRLDFDEIANAVEALCKRFAIEAGLFDQWSGIPLEQALIKKGLTQFEMKLFQRDFGSRVWQNFKLQMYDRNLLMYDFPVIGDSLTVNDDDDEEEEAAESTNKSIDESTALGRSKHSPLIAELLTLQQQQVSQNIVLVEAPKSTGFHDDMSCALVRSVWLAKEAIANSTHMYGSTARSPTGKIQSAMNTNRYQMMKARSHGVVLERANARQRQFVRRQAWRTTY